MLRRELLYLANHGLVTKEEFRFFKSGIEKALQDKKLTLIEYKIITKIFTELLDIIVEDPLIYNKLKKEYSLRKQERQKN